MAQNLSDAATYAALAELIYRRDDDGSQNIDVSDIQGSVLLSADVAAVGRADMQASDGRYYYNPETGFVGAIFTHNGKHVVVFRGTDYIDLNNKDVNDTQFVTPGGANIDLGFGTYADSQLDDAKALTDYAISLVGAQNVVVTGQSLGAGLAGLVSITMGVESYLYAPAPFDKQLDVEASKDGVSLTLSSWSSSFTSAFLNLSTEDQAGLLADSFFVGASDFASTYLNDTSERSAIASFYQSEVTLARSIYDAAKSNITEIHTINDELLTNTTGEWLSDFIAVNSEQFKSATHTYDTGPFQDYEGTEAFPSGEEFRLHSPTLHALVVHSEQEANSTGFHTLLANSPTLRYSLLGTNLASPTQGAAVGEVDDPSVLTTDGLPDAGIMYRALWNSVGETDGLYDYFSNLYGGHLFEGAVATGSAIDPNAIAGDPSNPNAFSFHNGVVKLSLQVLRTGLQDTDTLSDLETKLGNLLGTGPTINFAGGQNGALPSNHVVIDVSAIAPSHSDHSAALWLERGRL